MNQTPKSIVQDFYNSNLSEGVKKFEKYLHEDCKLHWSSSKGFNILDRKEISNIFKDIEKSYHSVRFHISHLLQDGNFVTTRYTLYVSTIENTEEEIPLAHYITIWEIRDNLLYHGHEISQPADDSVLSLNSFSEIKV